jgi:3-phosphoshikimate 1-carboxyvinyltransferase
VKTCLAISPIEPGTTATVSVPGSKSYTNRALLIAALTSGTVTLTQPLISDDTSAMVRCLRTLGITIDELPDSFIIENDIRVVATKDYTLDAHLSGTTIRFLLALSCLIPGRQTLTGDTGLLKRPIHDLVDSLRQLGADIEYLDLEGFPPLRVNSTGLSGTVVRVDGSTSSQFLSALLMIAPVIGKLTLEIAGDLVSQPYVEMTIDVMQQFDVEVISKSPGTYQVAPDQKYYGQSYAVEGDVSSACYFWAIATLTSSTITVQGVRPDSKQADIGFLTHLENLGSTVTRGTDSITVRGAGVEALNINMEDCPDQVQTMAVLSAFADGTTKLSGVRSLRVKETERVKALEQELAKMGIKTSSTNDELTIHGGSPHSATIATYGDHRMAMAFAVAGTKLDGMEIRHPAVVSKTFPSFWNCLEAVGSSIRYIEANIVLIGMRGSGKTTVAQLLAKTMGRELFDLDSLIRIRAGVSIPELIAKHDWEYFRDEESKIAQEVSSIENSIISTGGGIVLRHKNIDALKRHSFVVFLRATESTLSKRLSKASDRPALTKQTTLLGEINQLLKERTELYEAAADAVIDTDGQSAEAVSNAIIKLSKEQLA